MPWTSLALLAAGLAFGAALPVLTHAFRRSVGTGVMVLLIPGYVLLYAFTQFEHRYRHWLVPLLLGAIILSGTFLGLAFPAPKA